MELMSAPLRMSGDIQRMMEERGIRDEDIRQVLAHAESSGEKLYVEGENRFLAKKTLENFTPNVEYTINGGEVEILDVYSYIVRLGGPAED